MLTRENLANTVYQNVGAATLVATLTKVNFCQCKFSKFSLPQKAVPFKTKAVFSVGMVLSMDVKFHLE